MHALAGLPAIRGLTTERVAKSRWRTLIRAFGVVLAFICSVALIGYLALVQRCYKLNPSGNALFDSYARAVRDRQALRLFYVQSTDGGLNPSSVPDSVLAAMEPQFGKDPHYWELRCWNAASANFPVLSQWGWPFDDSEGSEFLEESRRRGTASSTSLEFLAVIRHCQAIHDELMGEATAAQRRGEELALLNEAISADPGRAWPRYRRAIRYCELGDLTAAEADLRAANAAPDTSWASLFPRQLVLEGLGSWTPGQHFPGNAWIDYGVVLGLAGFTEDTRTAAKGMAQLERHAVSTADLSLLTQLNRAYCRMGASLRFAPYPAALFAPRVRRVATAIWVNQGNQLSRRQRYMLSWVVQRTTSMGVKATYEPSSAYHEAADSLHLLELQAFIPPLVNLNFMQAYAAAAPQDYWASCNYLEPRYEQLQLVDYSAPDFGYAALHGAEPAEKLGQPDEARYPGMDPASPARL
jgi:hypothetical protein